MTDTIAASDERVVLSRRRDGLRKHEVLCGIFLTGAANSHAASWLMLWKTEDLISIFRSDGDPDHQKLHATV
jgi:hypothetical protein